MFTHLYKIIILGYAKVVSRAVNNLNWRTEAFRTPLFLVFLSLATSVSIGHTNSAPVLSTSLIRPLGCVSILIVILYILQIVCLLFCPALVCEVRRFLTVLTEPTASFGKNPMLSPAIRGIMSFLFAMRAKRLSANSFLVNPYARLSTMVIESASNTVYWLSSLKVVVPWSVIHSVAVAFAVSM